MAIKKSEHKEYSFVEAMLNSAKEKKPTRPQILEENVNTEEIEQLAKLIIGGSKGKNKR